MVKKMMVGTDITCDRKIEEQPSYATEFYPISDHSHAITHHQLYIVQCVHIINQISELCYIPNFLKLMRILSQETYLLCLFSIPQRHFITVRITLATLLARILVKNLPITCSFISALESIIKRNSTIHTGPTVFTCLRKNRIIVWVVRNQSRKYTEEGKFPTFQMQITQVLMSRFVHI